MAKKAALAPASAIPVAKLSGVKKQMAGIYNEYGFRLEQNAKDLGIDVASAAAVLKVESGGKPFSQVGGEQKEIVRFENHVFFDQYTNKGKDKARVAEFNKHFKMGTGSQRWDGKTHFWRRSENDAWQAFHGKQAAEYEVLNFAATLDETSAYNSISMGLGQQMGFNAKSVGYKSSQAMFEAFKDEGNQVDAVFAFVKSHPAALKALKSSDYTGFAKVYNGSAQAAKYGGDIKAAATAYKEITKDLAPSQAAPSDTHDSPHDSHDGSSPLAPPRVLANNLSDDIVKKYSLGPMQGSSPALKGSGPTHTKGDLAHPRSGGGSAGNSEGRPGALATAAAAMAAAVSASVKKIGAIEHAAADAATNLSHEVAGHIGAGAAKIQHFVETHGWAQKLAKVVDVVTGTAATIADKLMMFVDAVAANSWYIKPLMSNVAGFAGMAMNVMKVVEPFFPVLRVIAGGGTLLSGLAKGAQGKQDETIFTLLPKKWQTPTVKRILDRLAIAAQVTDVISGTLMLLSGTALLTGVGAGAAPALAAASGIIGSISLVLNPMKLIGPILKFGKAIAHGAAWSGRMAAKAGHWIGGKARHIGHFAAGKAHAAWNWTKEKASDAGHFAANKAHSAWDWTKDKASDVCHFAAEKAHDAGDWMKEKAHGVADFASGIWNKYGPQKYADDGALTGPFYPQDYKGEHYRNAEDAVSHPSQVALFVNGVKTDLPKHQRAAQELANQNGKPVVGIYNATGGGFRDVLQCLTDKIGVGGLGKMNPATNTLTRLIKLYGSPKADKGGLDIFAHSQGSIIVSEALREARAEGADIRGIDVTTFGNAAVTMPKELRGLHNYTYDDDVISTFGGSNSVPARLGLMQSVFSMFGMKSTAQDTFSLHHGGALDRPHGLIPDEVMGKDGKPIIDKSGKPVYDNQNYYLGDLKKFRQKEADIRARDKALGPLSGPARAIGDMTAPFRSIGSTAFAFGRTGASKAASKVGSGYGSMDHGIRSIGSKIEGGISGGYGKADKKLRGIGNSIAPYLGPMAHVGGLAYEGMDSGIRSAGRAGASVIGGAYNLFDKGASMIGRGALGLGSMIGSGMDSMFGGWNKLQRSGTGDHPDLDAGALRENLVRTGGSGSPLSGDIGSRVAGHLGFDPSGARVHTGPAAAKTARDINAQAFTIGRDVFFGAGKFDPATPAGLGLIAHELTHVGQQTGATGNKARFFSKSGGDAMEQEAQVVAERVLAHAGRREGLFVDHYSRTYESDDGHTLTRDDMERLDRISLMALQLAEAKMGGKGPGNLGDLDVQVAIDLGGMNDVEAAGVWANEIVRAVRGSHDFVVGNRADHRATVVQRYDSGEHAQLGAMKGEQERRVRIKANDGEVEMAYGEMIAMGDYYDTPEDMQKAPKAEIEHLLKLIQQDEAYYRDGLGSKVEEKEWEAATEKRPEGERYLDLAGNNTKHYEGANKVEFHRNFAKALHLAAQCKFDEANAVGAFGAHFLTDAFSAGHLINKVDVMNKAKANFGIFDSWAFAKMVALRILDDSNAKATLSDFEARSPSTLGFWAPVDVVNMSEIINISQWWLSDKFYSNFVKIIHDTLDNDIMKKDGGVPVKNEMGDKWNLSGDGTLSESTKTLEVAQAAVATAQDFVDYFGASAAALYNIPFAGRPVFPRIQYEDWMIDPLVWEVWKYVPVPTDDGQKQIDELVTKLTDPSQPETNSKFADVLIKEIDLLTEKLVANGLMRWAPHPSGVDFDPVPGNSFINIAASPLPGTPSDSGPREDSAKQTGDRVAREQLIIAEARAMLSSDGFAQIRASHASGTGTKVNIGGRPIQYEPGLPPSYHAMTNIEEKGFCLGPGAFDSEEELARTLLHELQRLTFSEALVAGTAHGEVATSETAAAADFADRAFREVMASGKSASIGKIQRQAEPGTIPDSGPAEDAAVDVSAALENATAPLEIGASVGRGGMNSQEDVRAIQVALNRRASAGLDADGKCGPKTIAAITDFQATLGGFSPDGLVEPGRKTATALGVAGKGGNTPGPPNPSLISPVTIILLYLGADSTVFPGTDYPKTYSYLDGLSLQVMMQTLDQVNRLIGMAQLFDHLDQASGAFRPKLLLAMTAVAIGAKGDSATRGDRNRMNQLLDLTDINEDQEMLVGKALPWLMQIETQRLIRKTGNGIHALKIRDDHNVRVAKGNNQTGNETNGQGVFIMDTEDPDQAAWTYIHEMNHVDYIFSGRSATFTNTPNKQQYIDKKLKEEAWGDVRAIEAYLELMNTTGTHLGSRYHASEYFKAYNAATGKPSDAEISSPLKEEGRRAGYDRILKLYRNGTKIVSGVNKPYPVFYGDLWDEAH